MSPAGDADLLVAARSALLDALTALAAHREALVLIGAQAIYLHTDAAAVALAETTKDSDLAVDPRELQDAPLLDDAMQEAGFHRDRAHPQPGSWVSPDGIPVDLMVPASLAGTGGRRGARIPPQRTAIAHLQDLFASSGDKLGAAMAGRAEELVGDPAVVTAATTTLADGLLAATRDQA